MHLAQKCTIVAGVNVKQGKAVSMRRRSNRAVAIAASKHKALQARLLLGTGLLLSSALLLLLISP